MPDLDRLLELAVGNGANETAASGHGAAVRIGVAGAGSVTSDDQWIPLISK